MGSADRETALLSVLFTDIVGSTEIASELGDEKWRELLARHHRIVRAQLRLFGGREVDTAGDGFLAVFSRPAAAARCAAAIAERVRALGLEIRAGVHVGQVERMGKKVGGVAVHTGARIAALAGPGEVLVSRTFTELVPGARFAFQGRGTHELKGLAGRHELFVVSGVDDILPGRPLEPEEARRRRGSIEPRAPRRLRRRGMVAAALAVVTAVVALVLVRPWREDSPGPRPAGPVHDALVSINPESGQAVSALPGIPRGRPEAADLVAGEGGLWISSALLLTYVDPETGETEHVSSAPVGRMAVGHGAVWIASAGGNAIIVVSPGRVEEEDRPVRLPVAGVPDVFGSLRVDAGADAIWAAIGQTLYRIDPVSRHAKPYDVGTGTDEIAAGEDSVWLVDRLAGTVSRFDIRQERVVGPPIAVQGSPDALEVGPADEAWVIDASGGGVFKVDPSGDVEGPFRVGPRPIDIAVGGGFVWVADLENGTITRLDRDIPSDSRIFSLDRPVAALSYDAVSGELWCYVV